MTWSTPIEDKRMAADTKARTFFEELWGDGDYWSLESSDHERGRYAALLSTIDGRRYPRALELGCGAGEFTRLVAPLADELVALDVAPTAIKRAREQAGDLTCVRFLQENVMEYDARGNGPWDLVIVSETIYYLGWLYSFFDVAWLASELLAATRPGGRLLLADTQAVIEDTLVRPWIIRTYHDLFSNVGFEVEGERLHRGIKDGVELDVLISLYRHAAEARSDAA